MRRIARAHRRGTAHSRAWGSGGGGRGGFGGHRLEQQGGLQVAFAVEPCVAASNRQRRVAVRSRIVATSQEVAISKSRLGRSALNQALR